MKYGSEPTVITNMPIDSEEMLFFMYLPIAFPKFSMDFFEIRLPKRLEVFRPLVEAAIEHEKTVSKTPLSDGFIYLTAKHIFATPDNVGNRAGYHSDGFGTDDINYIWANKYPTIFCIQDFDLSSDCNTSLKQMGEQAKEENEIIYLENTLLRLDEGVIHRTPDIEVGGMRTFVKVSFSKHRYNLKGNSHNYEFEYDWKMYDRCDVRNHPTTLENDFISE